MCIVRSTRMSIRSRRHRVGELLVGQSQHVAPHVDRRAAAVGRCVGQRRRRVAEDLELLVVVRLQQRQEESPDRMRAEIWRNVAHPQPAIRGAIVPMRCDRGGQRLGVPLVPTAMFFGHCPSVVRRAEMERVEQVAMRHGGVGLQLHRPAVAGDRLVEPALVLQDDAQVAVRRGIVGPQLQRPAVAGDRLVRVSLGQQGIAQVVVGLGIVRRAARPRGGGRRPPRPTFPGPARRRPGCCGPWHRAASAPPRGDSRQSPRPASLGPGERCPGCRGPRHSRASAPARRR